MRESIHAYECLDEEIEFRAILEDLAARPPLDAPLSEETEDRLPLIFGGVSTALARAFKLVEAELKAVYTRSGNARSACSGC